MTDRDPDARFLLADERSLLAWLRTSLALQARGLPPHGWAPESMAIAIAVLALLLLDVALGHELS